MHGRGFGDVLGCALAVAISCGTAGRMSAATLPAAPDQPASHTYDVARIKPSQPAERLDEDFTPDSYWARGMTLKMLVAEAFGVRRELVSGVPHALEPMRFDVQAKVLDTELIGHLTDEERPAMLRQVLEERFHLKTHIVMRVMPVYELVVTRGGPKLKPTPADGSRVPDIETWHRRMEGIDATTGLLADALSTLLDRNVIDRTELTGHYDFLLRWTPDAEAASDVTLPPGLFAALQDQLGLKLISGKGPVKTVVVDDAEMPGEN